MQWEQHVWGLGRHVWGLLKFSQLQLQPRPPAPNALLAPGEQNGEWAGQPS